LIGYLEPDRVLVSCYVRQSVSCHILLALHQKLLPKLTHILTVTGKMPVPPVSPLK